MTDKKPPLGVFPWELNPSRNPDGQLDLCFIYDAAEEIVANTTISILAVDIGRRIVASANMLAPFPIELIEGRIGGILNHHKEVLKQRDDAQAELTELKEILKSPSYAPQIMDDLVMLVMRLANQLAGAAPDHELPIKAMQYLQRNSLTGSILRTEEAPTDGK